MATLRAFREAVQADLQTALGIPFKEGMLGGPIAERDLGCCWAAGKEEVGGHVDDEQLTVKVRVFKRFNAQESSELPLSSSRLEELVEQIQAAVRDSQLAYGPWMARVVSLEPVIERQYVEATIVGWQNNAGL